MGLAPRSTAWAKLSQRPADSIVVAQLDAGDGVKKVRLASGPLHLENHDYLPLMVNIPSRAQSVDYWTRQFSVSNAGLEVLNLPITRNDLKWFIQLYMQYKPGFDMQSAILIALISMEWSP